ncbi:MAG TPA: MMPL family transporter, partial [Trueperaceae bacterium]|nr:MMPL family transporter [Trueperaceae bacterium]
LGTVAALVLVVMLYLNFRTVRGALLPLLTVIIGLAWAFGGMGWLGGSFNTLIAIAPVAILAVGSSFSLHLLGRFTVELAHGREKLAAVRMSVTETGLGVLISGLAISAAMLTFTLSGMPAVRTLGLLVSGGVLASLLTSLLLLPAILSLMSRPTRVTDSEAPGAIAGVLRWLGSFVAKRRWAILAVGGVMALVAGYGVTRIEANTAVLDYFRADSTIRLDYDKVEAALGGSSQVQVLVTGDLGDPATLQALSDFQARVDELPGTGPSNSIATVLSAIHETLTGEFALPTTREAVAQELLLYQLSGDVQQISKYLTLDSTMGLVDLSITTGSTKEQRALVDEIDAIARDTLGGRLEHSFAGSTMMQLAIEDALLHDFLLSLSLAVLLVIIIDSLVRSIPAALVTIVVLLLTILVQYGMLGYLGVPLDLATMLLGALAIGVGDYAIHLTVRYMEQLRQGDAPEPAMAKAILTSGRSILFTALTLGAGFGALIFSQFVPIRTLGSLMAFTVVSVGIISLLVLPAACLVFLRRVRGASPVRPKEVATHA